MIRRKRCKAEGCQDLFAPRSQCKGQKYCSKRGCQQKRKNKWQREKRKTDQDYRANDDDARRSWAEKNPNYSQRYRAGHPEYVEENRQKQRERNKRRTADSNRRPKTAVGIAVTDWQPMVWAGKRYLVKELMDGQRQKSTPMEDSEKSMSGRKERDCKRGRVPGGIDWETKDKALLASVRK